MWDNSNKPPMTGNGYLFMVMTRGWFLWPWFTHIIYFWGIKRYIARCHNVTRVTWNRYILLCYQHVTKFSRWLPQETAKSVLGLGLIIPDYILKIVGERPAISGENQEIFHGIFYEIKGTRVGIKFEYLGWISYRNRYDLIIFWDWRPSPLESWPTKISWKLVGARPPSSNIGTYWD